jgi:hypothetical protein
VIHRAGVAEGFGYRSRIANVAVNEIEAWIRSSISEVLETATVQVVQDYQLRAAIVEQTVDEVTAYKSCAARNDDLSWTPWHTPSIAWRAPGAVGRRLKSR